MQIAPSGGVWGGGWSGEGPGENYLVGADQKTSDKQIKTMFLGKAETALRSGVRSRFSYLRL